MARDTVFFEGGRVLIGGGLRLVGQALSKAAAAGTTATAAMCADGDCTNEAAAAGRILDTDWTVLGKYPEYLRQAKQLGANVFNIPMDEWRALGSRSSQWARNAQFLDEAIARGDSFRLATDIWAGLKDKGSFYHDELVYILQKGYELTIINDQQWLTRQTTGQ